MANWGHITGLIRLDSLVFNKEMLELKAIELKRHLGPMEFTDELTLPAGYNKTLEYELLTMNEPDGNVSPIQNMRLSLFGDLSEFTDYKELLDWLNEYLSYEATMSAAGAYIRDGVVMFTVEQPNIETIFRYNGKNWEVSSQKSLEEWGE